MPSAPISKSSWGFIAKINQYASAVFGKFVIRLLDTLKRIVGSADTSNCSRSPRCMCGSKAHRNVAEQHYPSVVSEMTRPLRQLRICVASGRNPWSPRILQPQMMQHARSVRRHLYASPRFHTLSACSNTCTLRGQRGQGKARRQDRQCRHRPTPMFQAESRRCRQQLAQPPDTRRSTPAQKVRAGLYV